MELTYLTGSRPAVFAKGTAVVLGGETSAPVLYGLWQRIVAGDDVGSVIGVLAASVGGRLPDLPVFAMVVLDHKGARVVVRGDLTVRVGTPDGLVEVSGTGVSTWTERWLPGAYGATIGSIDETVPSDGWLPLLGGIVHADAVRCGAQLPDPIAPPPAPTVAQVVPPHAIPTPEPEFVQEPEPVPEPDPVPEPAPAPHSPAGSEETLAGTVNEYDHLFGPTIHRRIEDAAVRPDEEDEGSGLISAVPGFSSTSSTAVDDDMTISRPQLAAARDGHAAAGPLPSVTGPGAALVLARTCASGHPNPPQRGNCWVCGAAVTGDGSRLPRPALGRLRLSTGAVVELDQDVVIGRRPEARRVADLPRLVTVPSPTEEISRSHLEVRLEDWHVLAINPGSTNETTLHRAGEEPCPISREMPTFLRTGDVLDLGDGVTIHVEGLP